MSDNMEKLEKLRLQIKFAAENDAWNIVLDAEKHAKEMVEAENARSENAAGGELSSRLSKFESDERKRVSETRYSTERKVLLHRNALVESLFDEIKEEIRAFVSSGEYAGYLGKCAERADRTEKLTPDVKVCCRKDDLETVGKIMSGYGIKAEADSNISLGGLVFRYPVKGIYLDLTLDTAFESEYDAFASCSEMQL